MEENTKNWALVVAGPHKYVGVIEDESPGVVTLKPCYEYTSELQIAQGQSPVDVRPVGRLRILVPFDHTLYPTPVHIRFTTICFFKDMAKEDVDGYKESIKVAENMTATIRRRRDTNLVLATEADMPTGGPPRAS